MDFYLFCFLSTHRTASTKTFILFCPITKDRLAAENSDKMVSYISYLLRNYLHVQNIAVYLLQTQYKYNPPDPYELRSSHSTKYGP